MYQQPSKPRRVTGATDEEYVRHLLVVLDRAHRCLDERGVPRPPKEIQCVPLEDQLTMW